MSLFRTEVLEAKRRRLWGEVRLSQPPSLMVWTVVLAALCAVIFSALVFGRYTRKETVPGFFVPEAGIVQLRPVQAGRISRVLVHEGDRVEQGAPLIEFTSDLGSVGKGPMLDVQLDEATHQRQALEERRTAVRQSSASERQRLIQQIEANLRARTIIVEQRRTQVDALAISEADNKRLSDLQVRGFAPNVEVDRRRRAVISERSALSELDARISQNEALTADYRSQLAGLPASEAETLASISGQISDLAQRRAELDVARGYVLRAPVAGVVSAVQARPGMAPNPDLPLLSIAPKGSVLQAHLLAPTSAAGFLKIGQLVRIQVDAFPFQQFGFVNGRIVAIASTVTRPGDAIFPIEQTASAYEVTVAIDQPYVSAYGERHALLPGMSFKADVPIDRRRLWQQLFAPLLAASKRAV